MEDDSDYWEREKMQALEKVQENNIGRNKIDQKEEKTVKKLMILKTPGEYRLWGRRGKCNRDYQS